MPADNTHHILAAAARRSEQTRHDAVTALRHMDATGAPVNFDAVARHAGVSRSWLYTQPDLRAEIERLRARHRPSSADVVPADRQRASEASLLRRLEAATGRIRRLEHDNQQLRDALARALGDNRTAEILGRPNAHATPKKKPGRLIGPC
ncbi:DUF6262 family protein [Pseudofrankia sp. BMG5.37]|uniref:DUF6262 family protein n=1 Tax=Pseudofrankia sp. BMG5.37 TaxID=3050035 RepID=UPI0028945D7C|nr:DUF6262 family protein [Pseudofrankia sp. BMG5.37]MDT3446703.1 DUF6262 family protein [Pseudofrankia sp. BMG5.37]